VVPPPGVEPGTLRCLLNGLSALTLG